MRSAVTERTTDDRMDSAFFILCASSRMKKPNRSLRSVAISIRNTSNDVISTLNPPVLMRDSIINSRSSWDPIKQQVSKEGQNLPNSFSQFVIVDLGTTIK